MSASHKDKKFTDIIKKLERQQASCSEDVMYIVLHCGFPSLINDSDYQ